MAQILASLDEGQTPPQQDLHRGTSAAHRADVQTPLAVPRVLHLVDLSGAVVASMFSHV